MVLYKMPSYSDVIIECEFLWSIYIQKCLNMKILIMDHFLTQLFRKKKSNWNDFKILDSYESYKS